MLIGSEDIVISLHLRILSLAKAYRTRGHLIPNTIILTMIIDAAKRKGVYLMEGKSKGFL